MIPALPGHAGPRRKEEPQHGSNCMKKILILSTALSSLAFAAHADITVMSWGGAYGEAQTEAFVKPFVAATGKPTVMVDSVRRSGCKRFCP